MLSSSIQDHIESLAVFVHGDETVQVVYGKFTDKGCDVDVTRLESGMSFLQVQAFMMMREKLKQVRSAICVNRKESAHIRLEAIAGEDIW
jgi:hypothetical protein